MLFVVFPLSCPVYFKTAWELLTKIKKIIKQKGKCWQFTGVLILYQRLKARLLKLSFDITVLLEFYLSNICQFWYNCLLKYYLSNVCQNRKIYVQQLWSHSESHPTWYFSFIVTEVHLNSSPIKLVILQRRNFPNHCTWPDVWYLFQSLLQYVVLLVNALIVFVFSK